MSAALDPRRMLPLLLCGLAIAVSTACGALPIGGQSAAQPSVACPRPAIDDPEALVAGEKMLAQLQLPGILIGRFAAADKAMRGAAEAKDQPTASCAADNVMYLLVGRFGRNAPPDALSPGILPADRDPLSDPGAAMTAMSIMPDEAAVEAIGSGILGSAARWNSPTVAWSDLEAAVVSGRVTDLDSPTMQAIGWAMLVQRASTLDEAQRHGRAGLEATGKALAAARQAFAINCATYPESECGG